MTDIPSEDAPDEITLGASLHATTTSRPSSPKQSPVAPMMIRAREGTHMTPTGKATEATLESLAQVGASQTATGNPTLLEPSPQPSGHTTHPPEISASPLSDGVVSLLPITPPRPQHPPPLSRSMESTGASSACYSRSSSELCR
ncbi:hypothetical protein MRX96_049569 [Rhipicephalus microplus]